MMKFKIYTLLACAHLSTATVTYDTYDACLFHNDCKDGECCGTLAKDTTVPNYLGLRSPATNGQLNYADEK